ncbi:glycosyltransferase [Mucilaginibacter hurinus]|uniref:Glycosyltransferase n=1 Tax=Mucilaginibacter hurinus TaxID=2201324 RepID=A0A367GNE5_9SPHI|nr:glycosyltransferase family 2 protein [Mucilaginibacter hurinus]RCH54558.1 glycosyltransferase [Mucilaginibacter hurinus]
MVSSTQHQTVTIIIVTYNAASTLQTCLDSVYMQAYPAIELVVIDGGSNDGTVRILEENANRIHYWKSEHDNGIYDAMNKALKKANGEWIYFLGADDELLPDFSNMCFALTDKHAIYYGSVLTRGLKPLGKVSDYYLAKHGIIQQSIIYPSVVFKWHNYNLKYPSSADFALNMQTFGDKRLRWQYLDFVIAKFCDTGVSGHSRDKIFEKDKPRLILKNFGFKFWLRFMLRKLRGRA